MSEEYDEIDAITRAMSKIDLGTESEISVKLYRKIAGNGRQAKEYVGSFDYVPDEECIKRFGAGSYQLRFESGGKTSTADVRIADTMTLAGETQAGVSVVDPMAQLRSSMAFFQEFKEMFFSLAPAVPTVPARSSTEEIAEILTGQNRVMMRTIMDLNKSHQKNIAEIYAEFEAERSESEYENTQEVGMMIDDGEQISEDDISVIAKVCTQLVGPAGGAIASMICEMPQVKKYRSNISVIRKIYEGTGLDRESMVQVGRMIKVPESILGML